MSELLCSKCDVYVGYAGAGVAKKPTDVPEEQLDDICWICRRPRAEIEADPYGRLPSVSTAYKRVSNVEAGGNWSDDDNVVRRRDADGIYRLYNVTRQEYTSDDQAIEAGTAIPAGTEVMMGKDDKAYPLPQGAVYTPIDHYIATFTGDEPRGGLTKDFAFNRKSFGEGQPENPAQNMIYVGLDGLEVTLEQDFEDEVLQHVCTYAINATRGIDPRNPPEPVDWEEMLEGGLQTALEDFRIAFAVYNMSRTGTHQVVRTRAAAFHQQSQRAHYYGDRPSVRMPESFVGKTAFVPNSDHDGWTEPDEVSISEEYTRLAEHAAWFYRLATDADISYQDARFGLLEGTTNFILWEGSIREFINVYAYRACSMFQWEISGAFRLMREVLVERHPYLAKYVKISCERTVGTLDGGIGEHYCTFQGWENVEGQCDFNYARESNRSFRSKHHRIEKKPV